MFIPSFSCRSPIKVEVAITRSPHRSVTYGFRCWSPIKLEVVITTRTCSPFHSITYGFSCWSPIRVVVNNMVMVAPRLKELLLSHCILALTFSLPPTITTTMVEPMESTCLVSFTSLPRLMKLSTIKIFYSSLSYFCFLYPSLSPITCVVFHDKHKKHKNHYDCYKRHKNSIFWRSHKWTPFLYSLHSLVLSST